MNKEPIKSFTQLDAWKEGHKLVQMVYGVATHYPKEELYCLTAQTKRCVVSVTSNIAEGFARYSYKEKVQFYLISQGSLTELQNQLLIARDVGYLSKEEFSKIAEQTVVVQKLVNGLIKKSRSIMSSR